MNIADIFRIGEAIFRGEPAASALLEAGARRWRKHELTGLVVRNGRSGWYLRVVEEGWVEAGMPVELLERRNPEWPVARANKILHHFRKDLQLTEELAAVPRLAASWVEELQERAGKLRTSHGAE